MESVILTKTIYYYVDQPTRARSGKGVETYWKKPHHPYITTMESPTTTNGRSHFENTGWIEQQKSTCNP